MPLRRAEVTRGKALKVLLLCALQGCRDFGYELAQSFHDQALIHDEELRRLGMPSVWSLHRRTVGDACWSSFGLVSRLFSKSLRNNSLWKSNAMWSNRA